MNPFILKKQTKKRINCRPIAQKYTNVDGFSATVMFLPDIYIKNNPVGIVPTGLRFHDKAVKSDLKINRRVALAVDAELVVLAGEYRIDNNPDECRHGQAGE